MTRKSSWLLGAELEAQLGGGALPESGVTTLAVVEVEQALALTPDGQDRQPLSACAPSCELGRDSVTRVGVLLEHLTLRAAVQDESRADHLEGRSLELQAELELGGLLVQARLDPPALVDREHDHALALQLELALPPGMLGALVLPELAEGQTQLVINEAQHPELAEALHEQLHQASLQLTVERGKESDSHAH